MKKVGIFGGSFNPIHTGHIALAKSLCEKACLDEVWFMVSPMNPFKKTATDLLDDQLRLEMVEKALEHEPQLKACDYEFRLPKPSYTWHTLQAISKDYPENEFTLLIGGDNWAAFDKWYHHDDILAHYPIVVYPRQGASIGNVPEGVTIVETPLLNISSTEIRKRIKEEESIRGMVPECIEQLLPASASVTSFRSISLLRQLVPSSSAETLRRFTALVFTLYTNWSLGFML